MKPLKRPDTGVPEIREGSASFSSHLFQVFSATHRVLPQN